MKTFVTVGTAGQYTLWWAGNKTCELCLCAGRQRARQLPSLEQWTCAAGAAPAPAGSATLNGLRPPGGRLSGVMPRPGRTPGGGGAASGAGGRTAVAELVRLPVGPCIVTDGVGTAATPPPVGATPGGRPACTWPGGPGIASGMLGRKSSGVGAVLGAPTAGRKPGAAAWKLVTGWGGPARYGRNGRS